MIRLNRRRSILIFELFSLLIGNCIVNARTTLVIFIGEGTQVSPFAIQWSFRLIHANLRVTSSCIYLLSSVLRSITTWCRDIITCYLLGQTRLSKSGHSLHSDLPRNMTTTSTRQSVPNRRSSPRANSCMVQDDRIPCADD